jgi:hypothetical protein
MQATRLAILAPWPWADHWVLDMIGIYPGLVHRSNIQSPRLICGQETKEYYRADMTRRLKFSVGGFLVLDVSLADPKEALITRF